LLNSVLCESAKRLHIARQVQEGKRGLLSTCETRFVERHDALLVFKEQFSSTVEILDKIADDSRDRNVTDTAVALSRAMTDSTFIVALSCAQKLMALTIVLSRSLQTVNQDLFHAMESVTHVLTTLRAWRSANGDNSDKDEWSCQDYGAFTVALKLATSVHTTVEKPRVAAQQVHRSNIEASSPSEFYRLSIWNPFLDSVITSLTDKFSSHHLFVLRLVGLVPSVIHNYSWSDIAPAYPMYECKLSSEEEVRHEFTSWRAICLQMPAEQKPSTPIEALDIVPTRLRNIKTLLTIFCTLPVTTCTAERSFQKVR
jgi:hypothetical protein